MQISVGAQCWDGTRRRVLPEVTKAELQMENQSILARIEKESKRMSSMEISMTGLAFIASLSLTNLFQPISAFAASPEAVAAMAPETKARILHAFDPLIGMIQSLSYPIAGVMIAGGCLFIMCGNKERGMQMLQNAALGYILVQISPMLLQLLVGIGSSV